MQVIFLKNCVFGHFRPKFGVKINFLKYIEFFLEKSAGQKNFCKNGLKDHVLRFPKELFVFCLTDDFTWMYVIASVEWIISYQYWLLNNNINTNLVTQNYCSNCVPTFYTTKNLFFLQLNYKTLSQIYMSQSI